MKKVSFDHWLKLIIGKESMPVDNDLEWELLLPKLEKKRRRRGIVYWILLPVTVTCLSLMYFVSMQPSSIFKIASIPDSQSMEVNNVRKDDLTNTLIDKKNNQTNILIHPQKLLSQKISKQELFTKATQFKSDLTKNDPSLFAEQDNTADGNSFIEKSQDSPNNLIIFQDSFSINSSGQAPPFDSLSISLLPVSIHGQLLNEQNFSSNLNLIESSKNVRHKKSFKVDMCLLGTYGKLFQSLNGSGNGYLTRKTLERPLDVFSATILFQTDLKSRLKFGIGLDYQYALLQLNQHFLDTVTQILYGVIVAEKTNAQNVVSYDTGSINVRNFRNVSRKLYHSRTLLSIPAIISYQYPLNRKWSLSYHAGISVPVYQEFSGRISNNSLRSLDLDNYGENISRNKLPCSVLYGMQVVYSIRPGIKWMLGLAGSSEIGYWRDLENSIGERHNSLRFQAGLSYRIR